MSDSLLPCGPQPARLLCPWDFPGNTGAGCHSFLQEIFPTQRLNPCLLCLLHGWVYSSPLVLPGKPLLRKNGWNYCMSIKCIQKQTSKFYQRIERVGLSFERTINCFIDLRRDFWLKLHDQNSLIGVFSFMTRKKGFAFWKLSTFYF